jgi:hypothetical protein
MSGHWCVETANKHQAEAVRLRRVPQRGRQAKLDTAIAANLPVRRRAREGGKELGYGG